MLRSWLAVLAVIMLMAGALPARGDEAATQPAGGKMKVGILVSEFTATGPHSGAQEYGYAHAKIAAEIKDPSIVLIPIIDPGSESEAGLGEAIKENFPDSEGKVLNAGDPEALKSLDAIVLAQVPNLKDEVLEGVTKVVSEGTPLLVVGRCGNLNPAYKNKMIGDLVGMTEAHFAWTRGTGPAEVVAKDDPLIKGLNAPEEWTVTVAGAHGKLNEGAVPLVKLKADAELRLPGNSTRGEGEDYFVLYQTTLEKGPVMVCNWTKLPDEIASVEGPGFYVRCLKRLVEAKKK
jgi:hypothetical protein